MTDPDPTSSTQLLVALDIVIRECAYHGTQSQRSCLILEVISITVPTRRQLALHFRMRNDRAQARLRPVAQQAS